MSVGKTRRNDPSDPSAARLGEFGLSPTQVDEEGWEPWDPDGIQPDPAAVVASQRIDEALRRIIGG